MGDVDLVKAGVWARESLEEVLATMLEMEGARPSEPVIGEVPLPDAELTAFVGLAGSHRGGVSLQGTRRLGRAVAARLLCADAAEVDDDEFRDAFGEIANMVAGGIKTRLEPSGESFEISLPVVVLAPETVQLRFQLASPLVRLETKCDDEVLRVAFSIARAR